MPQVPSVRGERVVRALERAGFKVARVAGSHHIMRHPDGRGTRRTDDCVRVAGAVGVTSILQAHHSRAALPIAGTARQSGWRQGGEASPAG
jgi:hypothetical protein